jgi:hypothetical protein
VVTTPTVSLDIDWSLDSLVHPCIYHIYSSLACFHAILCLHSDEPAHKDGLHHRDDKEELYPPGTLRVRDNHNGFVGRSRRWVGQEHVFQRTELRDGDKRATASRSAFAWTKHREANGTDQEKGIGCKRIEKDG